MPLRGILHDWATLGLIGNAVVVDVDQLRTDTAEIPALLVGAASRMVCLQERLADSEIAVARLCVISAADSQSGIVDAAVARRLSEAVQTSLPYARLVKTSLAVGHSGAEFAAAIPDLIGWDALVLSPEDGLSPMHGTSELTNDPRHPQWHLHVAGNCCSILGLWRGQEDSVLDSRSAVSDGGASPVRAFTRSVAADTVEDDLRRRLLMVGERYPVPRVDTSSGAAVEDENASVTVMADALLREHSDVLPRARTTPPAPAPRPITFGDALRQFFTFMWAALKNAPHAFAEGLLRTASAATAAAVNSVVYGANSSLVVVVRGVRPDGSPASWDETEQGVEKALQDNDGHAELGAALQKPQLWRDYTAGALTLLDAGKRSSHLPPVTMGSTEAVVTTTARVAPDPADAFTLPAHIAAYLPNWKVEVADDIGAKRLHESLEKLSASNPQLAQEIGAEKHRLREWVTVNSASYVGQVGRTLGNAFRATVTELEELTQRLEQLRRAPAMTNEIEADQRRLAARFRILGGVSLLVVVALIGLALGGLLAIVFAVVLVVVSLFATVLSGALMYMKGQRSLYQFIHAQEQTASALETAERHRKEALQDLRRLIRAYRQYLDWSRALCAFVHAPLGRLQEAQEQELSIGQGLPRCVRIGVATASPDVVDEAAGRIRGELFRAGWLSDHWAAYISQAPASLGSLRYALQSDPGMLDQDANPDGAGPVLTRWSWAVAQAAAERPASATFLARAEELVAGTPGVRDKLLSLISFRDSDTGEMKVVPRAEFEGRLDGAEAQGGTFRELIFSPHARNIDARNVDLTRSQDQFNGLAHARVLVQFGPSLPRTDYRTSADVAPNHTRPPQQAGTFGESPRGWGFADTDTPSATPAVMPSADVDGF
ncbi:hypothetical protein BKA23_2926 [Rudaeicoccus suwonensis]|uniref:Uncharacterized protein n=2 Tax=Rudaeicoccus suwonensis TaxID=657409 RepID=A0A561E0R1_9MICO|nr:hypothetical protein BKA23_2926 [Rudaeicoccus suwonensis]